MYCLSRKKVEENKQNNLTVWQRLQKAFGPNALLNQDYPTYKFDKKELLKTDDKEEFEKQKLQAQQSKYLGQMWKKVESGLFQQSINYETTRIGSYSDFEAMEFYPTIAASLDIFAEESSTLNDKGRIMNIYSDLPLHKFKASVLLYPKFFHVVL